MSLIANIESFESANSIVCLNISKSINLANAFSMKNKIISKGRVQKICMNNSDKR